MDLRATRVQDASALGAGLGGFQQLQLLHLIGPHVSARRGRARRWARWPPGLEQLDLDLRATRVQDGQLECEPQRLDCERRRRDTQQEQQRQRLQIVSTTRN